MANTLRYNNVIPGNIYYSNSAVQNVYYNNVKVWSASKPFAFAYTGAYETEGTLEGNFVIRFKTSGTLTITSHGNNTNGTYDVFCVGGGAGGGSGAKTDRSPRGGCGGYTTTKKKINASLNTSYAIVIGSGGARGTAFGSTTEYYGGDGGSSSGLGNTANGATTVKSIFGDRPDSKSYITGYGGSGGGSPAYYNSSGGNGGSDGSDGSKSDADTVSSYTYYLNGKGQSSTTREFGEATGKLYAGGGGGGGYNYTYSYAGKGGDGGGGKGQGYSNVDNTGPFAGTANTGGGGGAGYVEPQNDGSNAYGAAGGSGIVCIRNAR